MEKEPIEYKVRYFQLKDKSKESISNNYDGLILKVDEPKGQVENMTNGYRSIIDISGFRIHRGNYVVGPEYSLEEIEPARADCILLNQDKTGQRWQERIMQMASVLNKGLEGIA
jgi:hypothetical protein